MLYDVVVIGGGINGCGCAADAASRGLKVLLCEQDDLGAHTSSQSSKLIHGGLRYLEQYEFSLVKKALDEQHLLRNLAPHLIHPLALVLPNRKGLRPRWLLRLGLFIYDHLSRANTLPNSQCLKKSRQKKYFQTLAEDIDSGFLFYDCQTDDARLTINIALQAQALGAKILTRTKLIAASVENQYWTLTLQPQQGQPFQIKTKSIVNAAGPWVQSIAKLLNISLQQTLSYVKGSHIIIPKFYSGQHAYLLQNPDQRVIFVLPYHDHLLIGTTDVPVSTEQSPLITLEEISYLKETVQTYFRHAIPEIVSSFSGIRVLCADPKKKPFELSRDFVFELHQERAPVVSVLSGKLTTYRCLAIQVIDSLKSFFPNLRTSQTQRLPLPGSHTDQYTWEAYCKYAKKKYQWLEKSLLEHYLQTYGTRTEILLQNCIKLQDLGIAFGALLYQKEVDYVCAYEWAQSAEDILWRRTKFGLSLSSKDRKRLGDYLSRLGLGPTS